MTKVTIKDLLDAGIHFGHEKIGGAQKCLNTYLGTEMGSIIDLQNSCFFNQALEVIKNYASQGKNILFMGTKRQASEIIERYALECNQFFINKRWLGGMLTNWIQFKIQ